MKFSVLGSGSAGNSTILECGTTRILIDAGLSAKQLTLRLAALRIDPASLSAILLTHEHGDHTRGLQNFLKKFPIPLYATRDTAHIVREQGLPAGDWKIFQAGQAFPIHHLTIETFSIQHDAVDPVAFIIGNGQNRLGLVSDTGQVTAAMRTRLHSLCALFIEANYDDELLAEDTKRPWSTKQRISSHHGHLSNAQVADLLAEIAHPQMSRIVFGHLSGDCNCPQKVTTLITQRLHQSGHPHIALSCATQGQPTPWFEVAAPFRLT